MQRELFQLTPMSSESDSQLRGSVRVSSSRILEAIELFGRSDWLGVDGYEGSETGTCLGMVAGGCRGALGAKGSPLLVRENADRVLLRTMNLDRLRSKQLVIGARSEPYPSLEARFETTRRILRSLAYASGLRIHLVTRSPLVERDIDLLAGLARQHQFRVHIVIAGMARCTKGLLEPGTPEDHERFQALTRLREKGILAGVWIDPVLPAVNDSLEMLETVCRATAEAAGKWVEGLPLNLTEDRRPLLNGLLKGHFPQLIKCYERVYGGRPWPSQSYRRILGVRLEALRAKYGLEGEGSWAVSSGHREWSRRIGDGLAAAG